MPANFKQLPDTQEIILADEIDKEVEAIGLVLKALEPLTPEVRKSVVRYVSERLQISGYSAPAQRMPEARNPAKADAPKQEQSSSVEVHIKELKSEKKPKYAVEMAAIVAYYLENFAKPNERKDRITNQDILTYFKIADFKLPTKPQFTLPNAKAAGYFDAVGNGEYKLNAVGHNLVAHSLPRGKTE